MKLLYKKRANDQMVLSLIAEESDDLWNLYNLIAIDDEIEAFTVRKVYKEKANESFVTEAKKMVLCLKITKVEFEHDCCNLRVSGKNLRNNEFVKLGQYHTFNIGLNEKVKLIKNKWDYMYSEKLKESTSVQMTSEVAILLLDCGSANMYLLTNQLSKHIFNVSKSIHKKRDKGNNSLYKKSMEQFFALVINNLYANLNFEKIKVIVLGGPGFFKNDFYDFIYKTSEKKNDKLILSLKEKFLIVKTSSIYRNSLNEILNDESLKARILNMKVLLHISVLNTFYKYFDKNEERICYGPSEVEYACSLNAIESLLITDKVLRNSDTNTRKKYVRLVQNVKDYGGKVFVFSDLHTSGEQLNSLTGIAAILKFPVFFEKKQVDYSSPLEEIDEQNEKNKEKETNENNMKREIDTDYDGFM